MIKQKTSVLHILYLLCTLSVILIAGATCTVEDAPALQENDSGLIVRYKTLTNQYLQTIQQSSQRVDEIHRKIMDVNPQYMEAPFNLSAFGERLHQLYQQLLTHQENLDNLHNNIPDKYTPQPLHFTEAYDKLIRAIAEGNASDQEYYQSMLQEICSKTDKKDIYMVSDAINTLEQEVQNSINTQLDYYTADLPLKMLYCTKCFIVDQILELLWDTTINSWEELSDRICGLVQDKLDLDASSNEFLEQLKDPTVYDGFTTLKEFLKDLSNNLSPLLGDIFQDKDKELHDLTELLSLLYIEPRNITKITNNFNSLTTLINALIMHAKLTTKMDNITKGNSDLLQGLRQLVYSTPISKLPMLQPVINIINCSQDQVDGLVQQLQSNPQNSVPQEALEAFVALRHFIDADNEKLLAVIKKEIQDVLALNNEILSHNICINSMSYRSALYNPQVGANILVELDNNDRANLLSMDIMDLTSRCPTPIYIVPKTFDMPAQVVALYQLLVRKNPNRTICIDLGSLPMDSLRLYTLRLQKTRSFMAYLQQNLGKFRLTVNYKSLSTDLNSKEWTSYMMHGAISSYTISSQCIKVLLSIAAAAASIFINSSSVFTITPLVLVSICVLHVVHSIAQSSVGHKLAQGTQSVISYALWILLVLYTASLLFVMYNQIPTGLQAMPIVYTVLNLFALAVLSLLVFKVYVKLVPAKSSLQAFVRYSLYAISGVLAWAVPFIYVAMQDILNMNVSVGYGMAFLSSVFLFCAFICQSVASKTDDQSETDWLTILNAKAIRKAQAIELLLALVIICTGIIGSVALTYHSNIITTNMPYTRIPDIIASKINGLLV